MHYTHHDRNGGVAKDQVRVKVNEISEEKIPAKLDTASERNSMGSDQAITEDSSKLDDRIRAKGDQISISATNSCNIATFVCDVNEGEAFSSGFTWGVVFISNGQLVPGLIAHVVMQSGPPGLQSSSADGNPAITTFKWDNPGPSGTYKVSFVLQILFCPAAHTRACNDFLNNRNHPVTFTINVNGKPTANDQKVSVEQNNPLDIVLTATDPNNDKLIYIIESHPAHGSLNGEPPTLSYTPDPQYTGPDSFTFKANDGKIDSNVAVVEITVKPLICSSTATSGLAAAASDDCPGDFSLECSPGTTPPKVPIGGGSRDIKCTLTSKDGFHSPVSLTCKAIQVNPTINCNSDPTSLTPPAGGNSLFNIKVQTTDQTKKGNYEITVEGKSGSLSKSTKVLIECVSCFPPKTELHSHTDKIVQTIKRTEGYAGQLVYPKTHPLAGEPIFCTSTRTWGCRVTTDLYGLYNDPIEPPGIPNCTFGFGHKLHDGPCSLVDEVLYRHLYPGDKIRPPGITLDQANNLLVQDVIYHERLINPRLTVQITQEEYDALVDISFNGGPGAGVKIITNYINVQKCSPEDIVIAFLETANSGHKHDDRRLKEAALFNSGVYF